MNNVDLTEDKKQILCKIQIIDLLCFAKKLFFLPYIIYINNLSQNHSSLIEE